MTFFASSEFLYIPFNYHYSFMCIHALGLLLFCSCLDSCIYHYCLMIIVYTNGAMRREAKGMYKRVQSATVR